MKFNNASYRNRTKNGLKTHLSMTIEGQGEAG